MRKKIDEYPDYVGELDALNALRGKAEYKETLPQVLWKIIKKHKGNAMHTRKLYDRYKCLDTGVPIFKREQRYKEDTNAINNKLNNDFFSEIIDFFVGYFGNITYSYSETEESEDTTATGANTQFQKKAVEVAGKTLSDFVYLNSLADKDNQIELIASICGYVGRLTYHDLEGKERVLITMPYETIALTDTELTEPNYAVRYFKIKDINDKTICKVEFYDGDNCYYFEGGTYSALKLVAMKETLFGGLCPLQIIPKNGELMGDGEKVVSLIDAYDRATSDNNNEMENFANAILAFKNIKLDDGDLRKLKAQGSIAFRTVGTTDSDLYYVTKNINDAFVENHLDRLKNDIYRFSKTPNLSDGTFGSESGEARKFRITGIDARCQLFEKKLENAGVYMFRLLANAWNKKGISVDPMQCYMEFKRNFPLDINTEATAITSLISAGYPKKAAFSLLSFVDDVDQIMDMIDEEKEEGITSLLENMSGVDDTDEKETDDEKNKKKDTKTDNTK